MGSQSRTERGSLLERNRVLCEGKQLVAYEDVKAARTFLSLPLVRSPTGKVRLAD